MSRQVSFWRSLYVSLDLRPHLEYAIQILNQSLQRRATKTSIKHKMFQLRRKITNHVTFSLEISKNQKRPYSNVQNRKREGKDPPEFRMTSEHSGPSASIRGHSQRFRRESFCSSAQKKFSCFISLRHNFFLNRVAPQWNSLSESKVVSSSLNSFKKFTRFVFSENGRYSLHALQLQLPLQRYSSVSRGIAANR